MLPNRMQGLDIVNNSIYVGGYNDILYKLDTKLTIRKKIPLSEHILSITHSGNRLGVGTYSSVIILKDDKVLTSKNTRIAKAVAFDKDSLYFASANLLGKLQNETVTKTEESIKKYSSLKNFFCRDFDFEEFHKEDFAIYTYDQKLYHYKFKSKRYENDTIALYRGKKRINEFQRDASSGYRHLNLTWYKHSIISGGDFGYLFMYDFKKGKIKSFVGAKESFLDVGIQGDILAGLNSDGNLYLYNLLEKKKQIKPYAIITAFKDGSCLVRSGDRSFFASNSKEHVLCLKNDYLDFKDIACVPNPKKIKAVLATKTLPKKKIPLLTLKRSKQHSSTQ